MRHEENLTLSLPDRILLIQLLAKIPSFLDGSGYQRRGFLKTAGVDHLVGDLNGNALDAASKTIVELERAKSFKPSDTYRPLGSLLAVIIDLYATEWSEVTRQQVASIVLKYPLVHDATYLSSLINRFGLTDKFDALTDFQNYSIEHLQVPPFSYQVPPDDIAGLERVINSETSFIDTYMLWGALYSAQAVCRIERLGQSLGTGFLVGPDLVLTNQHVISSQTDLTDTGARFDFYADANGVASPGRLFSVDHSFYKSSPATLLDYALIKLTSRPLTECMSDQTHEALSIFDLVKIGKHRGYLLLADRAIKPKDRVNIVQHPNGSPAKVVMTQNYVVGEMTANRVHYLADTMTGSSGAPIFNHHWEVIGIHHSGKPFPNESLTANLSRIMRGDIRVNEGVPMSAILPELRPYLTF